MKSVENASVFPLQLIGTDHHMQVVRDQREERSHSTVTAAATEGHARSRAARLLTVKTLAPSHPDPGYALTRRFYRAMGFFPVEEFPALWNPEKSLPSHGQDPRLSAS